MDFSTINNEQYGFYYTFIKNYMKKNNLLSFGAVALAIESCPNVEREIYNSCICACNPYYTIESNHLLKLSKHYQTIIIKRFELFATNCVVEVSIVPLLKKYFYDIPFYSKILIEIDEMCFNDFVTNSAEYSKDENMHNFLSMIKINGDKVNQLIDDCRQNLDK